MHGLDTEMIVFMLAAGVCRLDAQLIRCIDELGQAFLEEKAWGDFSIELARERLSVRTTQLPLNGSIGLYVSIRIKAHSIY